MTSMHFTAAAVRPVLEQVLAHPDLRFELMVHSGHAPQDGDITFSRWRASWENEICELDELRRYL